MDREKNATVLKQVSSQKLLGVTIDQKLSFDDHIDKLCNKLCQRIAVLSKIKWFLPLEQRKAFYNAMIKQTMLYASNVWSACFIGNLQSVFRLQKWSARIILDTDMRANSDEPFTRLDWFPLHLELKVNICVQVHKRINVRSPGYMSDLLVNERNNRNDSLNLVCPRFKRETVGRGEGHTAGVRATRLWNAVPNSLKKIECVHSFKKALIDFYASS